MKHRRTLGALLLIIGITIAFSPLLQRAYGAFSQWQLEREWDAQVREAQGKTSQQVPSILSWNAIFSTLSIRTANAAPAKTEQIPVRRSRTPYLVSTTSRASRLQRSRHSPRRMGLARIEIPKIGMRAIMVEGTSNRQLAKGPAHFVGSALPGEVGNCAIAAHRNMYGSWFAHVNRLRPGDAIILRTPQKAYNYRVTHSKIVLSNDISVLKRTPKATVTLVTCMVPYSKHRLIVFGVKV